MAWKFPFLSKYLLYLIFMCVNGGIADGATEASGSSRCSHFSCSRCVLPSETKIQHVHFPTSVWKATHGKVWLLIKKITDYRYIVLPG